MKPGDMVEWYRVSRGGYGYVTVVPVKVVRLTAKRVRVRATLLNGGTRELTVRPESLHRTANEVSR